ncbi:tetratricopeptide repeat protein [Thermodesulfobacteriota bacterium]
MKRTHQLIIFVFFIFIIFGLAHGEKIPCSNAKISPYPIDPTPGTDHDKLGRIIVETIPAQLPRERTLLQRLVDFAKNGGGIAYAGTLDDKIKAHYDLGKKYANAEKYDDAIIEFRRVIALDYQDDDAHNWLGWIYRELGQLDKGIHEHEIAVEINPTPKNLRYLAHIYVLVGEYDKAIDACSRGINSADDRNTLSSLYNTRGAAHSGKKDWEKAQADYSAAIENNPDNKEAIENLKKASLENK